MSTLKPRAVYAEIDLDAIQRNLRRVKAMTGGRAVCAVVKADAYGHGALPVSKALVAAGADMLAVAIPEEALELREAGIDAPILVLGHTDPSNAGIAIEYRITHTVYDRPLAVALSDAALRAGKTASVHVKIDTGMNRLGLRPSDSGSYARFLGGLPGLRVEGIYSHFADADVPGSPFAREQFARFREALDAFRREGVDPGIRHIASSGAVLEFPEAYMDMVRTGILLYGLSPSGARESPEGFTPAMRLHAGITLLKTVPAGESVSYGRTYRTSRESRIATLPIGYADGYSRALSNRAFASLHGKRVPVVGRVCMDQCMLDVTDVPEAREGDEVLLFGGPAMPVGEIAGLLGTIDYEVVCMVKKRVPRVYPGRSEG
ncbi:MAG: alanine racemase [Rectinema sp.]